MEVITGKWHLLDVAADEDNILQHRVDLVFHADGMGYRGAILSRTTGEEIPLAVVRYDGAMLRLQMTAPDGKRQVEMRWLVMMVTNGRFEGHWLNSASEPTGPKLKLVRARK